MVLQRERCKLNTALAPVVVDNVYSLRDRLDLIAQRIQTSQINPQEHHDGSKYMLRDLALEIVRGTPQHGQSSEDGMISNIFWWTKTNIEYRNEYRSMDAYHAAGRTISAGAGDCDCHTILNAAMLDSLGFLTGARCTSPDNRSWHVYCVCGTRPFSAPTEIIPLDTTQPNSFPGWEPEASMRRFVHQATFKDGRAVGLRKVAG
jgi:hypothetical protein